MVLGFLSLYVFDHSYVALIIFVSHASTIVRASSLPLDQGVSIRCLPLPFVLDASARAYGLPAALLRPLCSFSTPFIDRRHCPTRSLCLRNLLMYTSRRCFLVVRRGGLTDPGHRPGSSTVSPRSSVMPCDHLSLVVLIAARPSCSPSSDMLRGVFGTCGGCGRALLVAFFVLRVPSLAG